MLYFYDFEQDKIISEKQLYSEYLEMGYDKEYSFADYCKVCDHMENGTLYTVSEYIGVLEKRLANYSRYNTDDVETIEDMEKEIEHFKQYK